MNRRRSIWAMAATALVALTCGASRAATPACDRACLRQALDTYLTAVTRHDAAAANLAPNYRATENARETAAGSGLWKTVTGLGTTQRRYFDPAQGQAAYNGLLQEDDKTILVSLRVKVDDRKISEAEWTIAREGDSLFSVAGWEKDAPPPEKPLPVAQRTSRFAMIALANGYFQGLQDHDGSLIPAEEKCPRIENGTQVTFRTRAQRPAPGSGATPTAAQEELGGNCVAGLEGFKTSIAETMLRRFPLVDEELGVVMGTTVFRRPPGSTRLRNLLTEFFYVRQGKLAGIWATMYYMPAEMPMSNGWSQ